MVESDFTGAQTCLGAEILWRVREAGQREMIRVSLWSRDTATTLVSTLQI